MEYVHFFLTTPICGTDEDKYICFDKEMIDDELNIYLDELVEEHTETWFSSVLNDIDDDDYETSEDFEEALTQEVKYFRENSYGTWERVTKEEWEENDGQFN